MVKKINKTNFNYGLEIHRKEDESGPVCLEIIQKRPRERK